MFKRRDRTHRDARVPTRTRNILFGAVITMCAALFFWGIWEITRLPSLTIQEVTVEGGDTISHERVLSIADEILAGDYLTLIPHRFSPMYPHDEIIERINDLERVETVALTRMSRTNLHISFTEYVPDALWCLSKEQISPCYFLDQTGYAFAGSPQLYGSTFVRHIREGETELKEMRVFEEHAFTELHKFLEVLRTRLELRVHDVEYTKDGDITLYVNGGGKIYLRNDGEYEKALRNLETVLSSEEFVHLEPGNFQYIDIRFGNKIFINETPEIKDTGAASTSATSSSLQ